MPRRDFYLAAEASKEVLDVHVYDREPRAPRARRGGKALPKARPRRPRQVSAADVVDLPPGLLGHATPLTIVAQDPSVTDERGVPLLATVTIPAERILPGPRDHRFYVVDYDPSSTAVHPPATLTDDIDGPTKVGWRLVDRFTKPSARTILEDRAFHAQNVYAVCAGLLNQFETTLGRRVPWGFGSHHLYLVPHAFHGANAGYSPENRSISFGYLPAVGSQKAVLSCLSHDVIADEMTHAILDGLRPRYIEPGLPDQLAFHEGFADIIALLAVFSRPGIVETVLRSGGGSAKLVDESLFRAENLKETALFGIGEQLGTAVDASRGALRSSLRDVPLGDGWRSHVEPHRRGEALVAAVSDVVATIWAERLDGLRQKGQVPMKRAAEEGAKVAEQVMGMCIRALDYLPPIELEFEDFFDAILAADEVVVPDDKHDYRGKVTASFGKYGIRRQAEKWIASNELAHTWRYQGTNHKALATSVDEVYRFLWQNADNFGLSVDYHLEVERVLAVTRTGPDGLVVEEVIADYTQTISAPFASLPAAWRTGITVDPGTEVQTWGGGVVVFDQYGLPRHHVTKPLLDAKRQNRRLAHLADTRAYDTRKRLGFSYGESSTTQFQMLHTPTAKEGW